jgi:hypothetical protein
MGPNLAKIVIFAFPKHSNQQKLHFCQYDTYSAQIIFFTNSHYIR